MINGFLYIVNKHLLYQANATANSAHSLSTDSCSALQMETKKPQGLVIGTRHCITGRYFHLHECTWTCWLTVQAQQCQKEAANHYLVLPTQMAASRRTCTFGFHTIQNFIQLCKEKCKELFQFRIWHLVGSNSKNEGKSKASKFLLWWPFYSKSVVEWCERVVFTCPKLLFRKQQPKCKSLRVLRTPHVLWNKHHDHWDRTLSPMYRSQWAHCIAQDCTQEVHLGKPEVQFKSTEKAFLFQHKEGVQNSLGNTN